MTWFLVYKGAVLSFYPDATDELDAKLKGRGLRISYVRFNRQGGNTIRPVYLVRPIRRSEAVAYSFQIFSDRISIARLLRQPKVYRAYQ